MFGKIFSLIKGALPIIWKILKVAIIVGLLWYLLSLLNAKFGIFSWMKTIFSATAGGISKLFGFIGVKAVR